MGVRRHDEIAVPLGMDVASAPGGEHDEPIVVAEVQQRHRVPVAGDASGRGEQQHVVVDQALADAATR